MDSSSDGPIYRILLLEDSEADTYLFRQAMKNTGLNHDLTVIDDGEKGLDFAQRQGDYAAIAVPDLAVLDLNLPKAGGAAVLAAMRQHKELVDVPVIILSSSETKSEKERAQELGVARYITKPMHLVDYLRIGDHIKELLLESKAALPATSTPPE